MKPDYKGRAIHTNASHSGKSGPYKGSFSVSRERNGNWELEYQGYLEQEFPSENEASAAARAAALAWIDQQADQ